MPHFFIDPSDLIPLEHFVLVILADKYRECPVILQAVVELLRDYNPYNTKTGMTKAKV